MSALASLQAGTVAIAATVVTFYKTFPLVASFLTASTKGALSDSLAQWCDVCCEKFSVRRNIAMLLYSGCVLGLGCAVMYNRVFPVLFGAEQTTASVVKMTLFDGFVNAPLLWLPPAYIVQVT